MRSSPAVSWTARGGGCAAPGAGAGLPRLGWAKQTACQKARATYRWFRTQCAAGRAAWVGRVALYHSNCSGIAHNPTAPLLPLPPLGGRGRSGVRGQPPASPPAPCPSGHAADYLPAGAGSGLPVSVSVAANISAAASIRLGVGQAGRHRRVYWRRVPAQVGRCEVWDGVPRRGYPGVIP